MTGSDSGPDHAAPRRLGRLTLFEPLEPGRPDGPWIGREDGRVALLAVDFVPDRDRLHRPRVQTLTHPAIESLIDRRRENGRWVQLRELVFGASLREVLAAVKRRNERIPAAIVRGWLTSVLDALEFLERAPADGAPLELRHGDLSVDTVRATFGGTIRVCGHALIRLRPPDEAPTRPGDSGLLRDVEGATAVFGASVAASDAPSAVGADLLTGLATELDRWRRRGPMEEGSLGDFASRIRARLVELPPPPAETEVGAWLGDCVPEVERTTLARLRRIRTVGARLASAEASDDSRTALSLPEIEVRSEPFEPSVITMPGDRVAPEQMPPQRSAVLDDETPTEPRRWRARGTARAWRSGAAALGVAVLSGLGWWLGERVVTAPEERAPPIVASPPREPAPSLEVPAKAAPSASSEKRGPPTAAAGEPRSRPRAPERASTETAVRGLEPPEAGDRAPAEVTLRARLTAAEAAPDDPEAFQAVLDAARERLTALGQAADSEAGRGAQAALRRAELSWQLDALRRAVARVEALDRSF